MLVSATCGPFISKLMSALLTEDEMKGLSKTGGTSSANNKRLLRTKQAIPLELTNAIQGKNLNTLFQKVLKS